MLLTFPSINWLQKICLAHKSVKVEALKYWTGTKVILFWFIIARMTPSMVVNIKKSFDSLLHVFPSLGAHVDSVVVCLLNWNFASSIKVMCVWDTLVYKGKCRDHHGMQTNANLHFSGSSYSAVPDYSGPVMSYYSLCVSAALCECYWMVSTVMLSMLILLSINNWTLSLMFLGYCSFMLIIFCPF